MRLCAENPGWHLANHVAQQMPGVSKSVLLQGITDVRYQSLGAHHHTGQVSQSIDNK